MPRTRKYDGVVYRRDGTQIWWIRYRDRRGIARRESSQTADWEEANKKLRERLLARDANLLEVVRKGETLTRAMVGFLLGELFQAAHARRRYAPGERAVH